MKLNFYHQDFPVPWLSATHRQRPKPRTLGSAHFNAKEREKKKRQARREKEKKWVEVRKVNLSSQTQAITALIGNEEQNEKQEKEQKERNNSGISYEFKLRNR